MGLPRLPFRTVWRWIASNRYQHTVTGLEPLLPRLPEAPQGAAQRRITGIRSWLKVRLGVLTLLYFNVVIAVVAWVTRHFAVRDELLVATQRLGAATSAFVGLFALVFLIANRVLGQLEADLVALLLGDLYEAVGEARTPPE